MIRFFLATTALIAVACCDVPAAALTVTMVPSDNPATFQARAQGNDTAPPAEASIPSPATAPFADSATAIHGDSSATLNVNIQPRSFEFAFTLVKGQGSGLETFADASGAVIFLVDEPAVYAIEGGMATRGPIPGATKQLDIVLRDSGVSGAGPFQNLQRSNVAAEVAFLVGKEAGDEVNTLIGTPSGTLKPGVLYQFYTSAYIQGGGNTTAPIDGWGRLTVAVIPEPDTAALLGFGLAGIAATRRFPRRSHSPINGLDSKRIP